MQSTTAEKSPPHPSTNGVTSSRLNGIQRKVTPAVMAGQLPPSFKQMKPKLSAMGESTEEGIEEDLPHDWTSEMSAEAQAHNISMFLCSSTSDSGERW